MTQNQLLVVDDDPNVLRIMQYRLEAEGYRVFAVPTATEACDLAKSRLFDLALIDLKLNNGQVDGVELMCELHQLDPVLPVIILTAYGTIANAVEAMRRGAYSYLTKPFEHQELLLQISKGLERSSLSREVKRLQALVGERLGLENIIGKSKGMQDVLTRTARAAEIDSTVMIYGESGTGKELIAKSLHLLSDRKEAPFVAINCASIPENLLESELFGYERGAFTGAVRRKKGLFCQADRGTLFLDEISEMPISMQAKLLRVLEEREVYPLGAEKPLSMDVRFIAASNQDLQAKVSQGTFREDLYYRLHVIPLYLPPLRERVDDIPLLAEHFLRRFAAKMDKQIKGLSTEAMQKLLAYNWPGNVRELENTLEYAVAMSPGELLEPDVIFQAQQGKKTDLKTFKEAKATFEREYLTKVLAMAEGNVSKAASMAGKFRADVYELLKKHNLKVEDFKTKTKK